MPEFCCSSTGPKSDLEGERERERGKRVTWRVENNKVEREKE